MGCCKCFLISIEIFLLLIHIAKHSNVCSIFLLIFIFIFIFILFYFIIFFF